MKIGDKEVDLFDDENEQQLHEFVANFYVIRKMMQEGTLKLAPHDTNFTKAFKKLYNIELDVEEMIELRDFIETDYDMMVKEKIELDRINGMQDIDLTGII